MLGKGSSSFRGTIFKMGGITIAQDEASSVVYGMPKVASEMGFIHRIVPLSDMAGTINSIALAEPG